MENAKQSSTSAASESFENSTAGSTQRFWDKYAHEEAGDNDRTGEDVRQAACSWPLLKAHLSVLDDPLLEGFRCDIAIYERDLIQYFSAEAWPERFEFGFGPSWNDEKDLKWERFACYLYQLWKDIRFHVAGTFGDTESMISTQIEQVKRYCARFPMLNPADFPQSLCRLPVLSHPGQEQWMELEKCFRLYREHVWSMDMWIESKGLITNNDENISHNRQSSFAVNRRYYQREAEENEEYTIRPVPARKIAKLGPRYNILPYNLHAQWMMPWNSLKVHGLVKKSSHEDAFIIKKDIEIYQLGMVSSDQDIKKLLWDTFDLATLSTEEATLEFGGLCFKADFADGVKEDAVGIDLTYCYHRQGVLQKALAEGKICTILFGCRLMDEGELSSDEESEEGNSEEDTSDGEDSEGVLSKDESEEEGSGEEES